MDIFEDVDDILFNNDMEEIIDIVNPQRIGYHVRERNNNFERWNDSEFFQRFRVSKLTALMILQRIENHLQHRTERNNAVLPMQQLLIALRFCATGNFYISVADFGGIHKSTACKIIHRVILAIAQLHVIYIKFPETQLERSTTIQKLYDIAHFPRILGALDCTHIKLQSPGGENPELYRNRKGFFSLNVQCLCNPDYQITNIVARWPGAAHDTHIFDNSALKMQFETGQMGNGLLLGDSGYPQRRYLMTPLANPQTNAENLYNESHCRTRNVIERTFGILKRRFPILSLGIRTSVPFAQNIITACVILHNIACENRDNIPDVDYEILQENFEGDNVFVAGDQGTRRELIDYFATLL